MANSSSSTADAESIEFSVRAADMANEFGSIFVRKEEGSLLVQLSLMPDAPDQSSKVWNTGVALDASASMKKYFGRGIIGHIPAQVAHEYENKGWLKKEHRDGRKVRTFTRAAIDDALKRNLISLSPNTMDYVGSEYTAFLAKNKDRDGSTTVIYWGGGDGSGVELFGEINEKACADLNLDGPAEITFGNGSLLLPALKYFLNRYSDSQMGLFVFITDGNIDDLPEVQDYTATLAQEILSGHRTQLKCVIVGVGEEIDEKRWRQINDLDGAGFTNIWDCMQVTDFQEMLKIFAEVIRDSKIVAKQATIYDDQNKVVKRYPDGVPARLVFTLPDTSAWFELDLAGRRIRQSITVPTYA